ncbi:aminoglycoside phosphotransferase family protein [Actinocorallia aurantiaca]|uniref:Aminoglycoside phosphotransferase family protein n=1 Tax=Actinocorallia aurantiaca TaxID=46204 RepID=A0ABP6GWM9_9ACTN
MNTSGIDHVLGQACYQAGLDASRAELIRRGENVLFRVGDTVLRIGRPGQWGAASREIAVSRWLTDSGIPAVRVWAHMEQPLLIDERPITFWQLLPPHRQGRPGEIGALLKKLHHQPVPTHLGLGHLDPFVRLPERIAAATTLPDDDRAWLVVRLAELRTAWAGLLDEGTPRVVHGDAWAGNVPVVLGESTAFFLDLERFSIGSPNWDLASTAIKHTSFEWITRQEYEEFSQAVGSDVTAWPGFPIMRDLRELRMTCYLAQHSAEHPGFHDEVRLRVDCLRGRHGDRPWRWTPLK